MCFMKYFMSLDFTKDMEDHWNTEKYKPKFQFF